MIFIVVNDSWCYRMLVRVVLLLLEKVVVRVGDGRVVIVYRDSSENERSFWHSSSYSAVASSEAVVAAPPFSQNCDNHSWEGPVGP